MNDRGTPVKRLGIWLLLATTSSFLWLATGIPKPPAATAEESDPAWGSITGQFVLEGEIPERRVVVKEGDPNVDNPAICAATDILSDELVIDPKTKAIADIFVYLPKAENVHPKLKESEKKEVELDQKGCRFIPHALFVRTDQVVRVKSDDACAHNTRTVPLKNQPANVSLTASDRVGVEFKNKLPERLPFEVQCNIHRWMSARWLVLDHPYAAVADANGKFKIADLPAGEHEFVIWQEAAGYVERKFKVNVVGGKTTDLGTIKVPVAKFAEK
jgi:hypothetical protein